MKCNVYFPSCHNIQLMNFSQSISTNYWSAKVQKLWQRYTSFKKWNSLWVHFAFPTFVSLLASSKPGILLEISFIVAFSPWWRCLSRTTAYFHFYVSYQMLCESGNWWEFIILGLKKNSWYIWLNIYHMLTVQHN